MKALPNSNIRKFHVHWNSRGISPNGVPEHAEYIANLCKEVESLMKEQITSSIHKKVKSDVGDPLYDEVVQHLLFCQTKCSTFHGRKEILERCRTYLQVNLFYYCKTEESLYWVVFHSHFQAFTILLTVISWSFPASPVEFLLITRVANYCRVLYLHKGRRNFRQKCQISIMK